MRSGTAGPPQEEEDKLGGAAGPAQPRGHNAVLAAGGLPQRLHRPHCLQALLICWKLTANNCLIFRVRTRGFHMPQRRRETAQLLSSYGVPSMVSSISRVADSYCALWGHPCCYGFLGRRESEVSEPHGQQLKSFSRWAQPGERPAGPQPGVRTTAHGGAQKPGAGLLSASGDSRPLPCDHSWQGGAAGTSWPDNPVRTNSNHSRHLQDRKCPRWPPEAPGEGSWRRALLIPASKY